MTGHNPRGKVVVAGATGFIGSHLVERLVRAGADVLAISRTRKRLQNLAAVDGRCRFVQADIADADHIGRLFEEFRPDVVYHLACHPDGKESFQQVQNSILVNTLGVAAALDAACNAGASTFVLADSVKVFGNAGAPARLNSPLEPECSYAIAKVSAWQLCRLYSNLRGIRVVGIRPTFVYGPRQNWNLLSYVARCIETAQPVRLQGGSQSRDPLYVSDAVEAFVRAAESDVTGVSIPIGGGCEMTVREICERVLRSAGSALEIEEAAEPPRATEIWRSYCDNDDAFRLLNWKPQVSLSEGLAECVSAGMFTGATTAAVA